MLGPLVKKNQVAKLGCNLPSVIEWLAVPNYVWKQGIHSTNDLASHLKRVKAWLAGVKTLDDGSATRAYEKAYHHRASITGQPRDCDGPASAGICPPC